MPGLDLANGPLMQVCRHGGVQPVLPAAGGAAQVDIVMDVGFDLDDAVRRFDRDPPVATDLTLQSIDKVLLVLTGGIFGRHSDTIDLAVDHGAVTSHQVVQGGKRRVVMRIVSQRIDGGAISGAAILAALVF